MERGKDAILRILKVARLARKASGTLREIGFGDELLFDMYGDLTDALFYLIGEDDKQSFEQSLTYMCVVRDGMSDEECAEMLYDRYLKSLSEQPAPKFIDREKMRQQAESGCGYIYETPEGDWTK